MSNLTKGIVLVVVVLAIGVGLVIWKQKAGAATSFNSITRPELEMLLADVAKTNPMILKRLNEDPEMKKQQIENLKQLLAFASEAKREGLADDPTNKQELENIRSEILAVNYDHEINKDKGPMPPFGFITEDQVKAYWGDQGQQPEQEGFFDKIKAKIGLTGTADSRTHDAQFEAFLDSKVAVMKEENPDMKDRQITDEEKQQARDIFAKIQIYKNEYDQKVKAGQLPQEFIDKANLQVKLQQAQFLARLYSKKAADQLKVTDEEINNYIAQHPDIDPAQKKAQAQQILDRAKNGEDFAALANQYTQDPGNKGANGEQQGGLYKDVPKGRMVAPFEQAALALQPGQVAPDLVETDFGYHIIKLERALGPSTAKDKDDKDQKGAKENNAQTYDVRHILISTGVKDPDNPTGRETPVRDYVRAKLEKEKEDKLIADIVAKNNVQVPDDFTVPTITDEQLKQMQQQNQAMPQMPGGDEDDTAAPPAAPGKGDKDAKAPDTKAAPKKR